MKYRALFYFSMLFLLGACSSEEDQKKTPSVYDEIELELNGGKKWDVSDKMQVFMDESSALLAKNKGSHEMRSEKLIELKNSFVSSCDMEGHGHDVLHAWLMPYMDLLDTYKDAKMTEDRGAAYDQLIMAHKVFNDYFE
ncbi:MAG: hypothetical protein ACJA0U_003270 [Salibacteraceae bacterium]|jgi:hypothetical protein